MNNSLLQWFSHFHVHQRAHLGGLVAKQIAGPIPGVSDAVDLRRGREFTLLNRFPGDAAGGPLKTTALLHFLAAWPLV